MYLARNVLFMRAFSFHMLEPCFPIIFSKANLQRDFWHLNPLCWAHCSSAAYNANWKLKTTPTIYIYIIIYLCIYICIYIYICMWSFLLIFLAYGIWMNLVMPNFLRIPYKPLVKANPKKGSSVRCASRHPWFWQNAEKNMNKTIHTVSLFTSLKYSQSVSALSNIAV